MKFPILPALGMLLAGSLAAAAKQKTETPIKINPALIDEEPYRYNGVVLTDEFRGSGFCAWNRHTFFSAAHVLYGGTQWAAPPTWYAGTNAAKVDETKGILSRGYFRWSDYADMVAAADPGQREFGRDVVLAYAFQKIIKGRPAPLNLNGTADLRKNIKTLITGYPADNLYIDTSIDGYFLHKTGPMVTPYKSFWRNALTTTLVTTGHGNSGGPIWTRGNSQWNAAGVLVGGRPSESIVYAFSKDTHSLLRAVAPVIKPEIEAPGRLGYVEGSSLFFPYHKDVEIPDGRHRWTSLRILVNSFKEESTLKTVKLSLDIRTRHRGDLFIILEGPGGIQALVHNEQGAGKDDLILTSQDFSGDFAGIDPNGEWNLRVQDRLAGDKATLKSILLEIAVDDTAAPPAP